MANLDAIYRVVHQPSGHVVHDFDREDSAIQCAEDENEEYPGAHVVVKYVRADLAQQPAALAVPAGWRVMWAGASARIYERWEIYAPDGSGGVVQEDSVKDRDVRALLDALAAQSWQQPAATVPEGRVMVPVEPTDGMLREMMRLWTDSDDTSWAAGYRAMLAAARKETP